MARPRPSCPTSSGSRGHAGSTTPRASTRAPDFAPAPAPCSSKLPIGRPESGKKTEVCAVFWAGSPGRAIRHMVKPQLRRGAVQTPYYASPENCADLGKVATFGPSVWQFGTQDPDPRLGSDRVIGDEALFDTSWLGQQGIWRGGAVGAVFWACLGRDLPSGSGDSAENCESPK